MAEFEVNPTEVCSICGQEKEPEELSELDGQVACLDCIAEANVLNSNVPLEQIAAASQPTPPHHSSPRRSKLPLLLCTLLLFAVAAGGAFYIWRIRQRQDMLRTSVTSLKIEGDNLARAGKLDEALARYEAVLKQLQGRPLSDPQLVELYHQAEKSAAGPYHKLVVPRLERVEAMLMAGRSEDARGQFRELANFINAHTFAPEISIRERIDRVTDQLKVPRIAKANWRKETRVVAVGARPDRTITPPEPIEEQPGPASTATNTTLTPQPQPAAVVPSAPKPAPPKPPEAVSVPDANSQARALEQIRALYADKYAQRDALGRRALAHLLLIKARETTDSTTRFVLLNESRDLAVRAAEPRIALAAVDELAESFLVSDVSMRVTALAESAQTAFTAEANELIAEIGLELVDRMAAEKRYAEAYRCAVIANAAAQQSRQTALISKSAAKVKEFKR